MSAITLITEIKEFESTKQTLTETNIYCVLSLYGTQTDFE